MPGRRWAAAFSSSGPSLTAAGWRRDIQVGGMCPQEWGQRWELLQPPRVHVGGEERGGGSDGLPGPSWSHPGSSLPAEPALLLLSPKNLRPLSRSQRCPRQGWETKPGTVPAAAGSGARGHRPTVLSAGGCRIQVMRWRCQLEHSVGVCFCHQFPSCLFQAFLSSSFLGCTASLHRTSQLLLSCRLQLCKPKKIDPKVPFAPV